MNTYVVDASVILKWVLGSEREADHGKAQGLLNAWAKGRIELSAPLLWQYEVGDFLGREIPEEAAEKMALLLDLKITSAELNESMFRECFAWMNKHGVTFYDASYLALAQETQGTLVTADKKFARKMGASDHVCLLKDLDLDFAA